MKCKGCGVEFPPSNRQKSRGWGYHSRSCANGHTKSVAQKQAAGRAGARASHWRTTPAVPHHMRRNQG